MSNAIFPTLPGLAWGIQKSPQWATQVRDSASGRQYTLRKRLYPLWRFRLPFEVLRKGGSWTELETLVGFINARGGRYDDFLYQDPRDYTVSNQATGTGDGATTTFQLLRSVGGFIEPLTDVDAASVVLYKNAGDWRGKEQQYLTARTNNIKNSQALAGYSPQAAAVFDNMVASPTGAVNATRIAEAATNAAHGLNVGDFITGLVNGQTVTGSWFVKAGERSRFYPWLDNGAGLGTTYDFDAVAQTITQTRGNAALSNVSAGFKSYGNGWFRIWITATVNNAASIASLQTRIYIGDGVSAYDAYGEPTYLGDTTKGAYAWGAQLESGPLTPYIPTAGTVKTVTDATLAALKAATVTFATAPEAGAALTWSGNFYFRCRFEKDEVSFEQFMQDLWAAKAVEFRTFRP